MGNGVNGATHIFFAFSNPRNELKRVMRRFLIVIFTLLVPVAMSLVWWGKTATFEKQFDALIEPIATEQRIDPLLIRAVIWRESRFRPHMRGGDGERGLMQIMEIAADDWLKREKIQNFDYDQLFDPETNIRIGTWYLARAMRRWEETDEPLVFALAEYNAGRTHALRWVDPERPRDSQSFLERIDFPTTKRYVSMIQKKYYQYQEGYIQPPWVTYAQDWKARLERKWKKRSLRS